MIKPKFHEILPEGAQLFQAYGHTDTMKLIIAFRSFANAPKKVPAPPPPFHFHSSYDGGFIASDNPTVSRLTSHCCY